MKKRHLLRQFLGLFTLLVVALASSTPALAAMSPGGTVEDRTGSWTQEQLSAMEEALQGQRFAYRVLILGQAFPDGPPADKVARFQAMTRQLMTDLAVPRDTVLVTVAMQEKLVDFRVWADGPVDAAYREVTGAPFGASSQSMLQAFAGPARSGDTQGAILAAVVRIEAMATPPSVQPLSPVPPVPPVPPVAPVPPVPPVAPVYPGTRDAAPESPVWPWVLGASAVGLGGLWAAMAIRYRRRHQALLALRDTFLEDLLKLIQQDLPVAKGYVGEESHRAVAKAASLADRCIQVYDEGTAHCQRAERLARQTRFYAGLKALKVADEFYQAAACARQEARTAYQPVADAIHEWEAALAETAACREQAESGLADLQSSTGWALGDLGQQHQEGLAWQQEGEGVRTDDPVRAIRLVREAGDRFQWVRESLTRLREQREALAQNQARRSQVAAAIQDCRSRLSLRFVEADPDERLRQAGDLAAEAARQMAAGAVEAADTALAGAAAAVARANSIVERYREAIAQYPSKVDRLTQETRHLEGEVGAARQVIDQLRHRYDVEDWDDVRLLPEQVGSFAQQVWDGVREVARLTTREEQRYLKAVELLDGWLAERARLTGDLAQLRARPAQFAEMERQGQEQVAAATQEWEAAAKTVDRYDLRLPPELDQQRIAAESSLNGARLLIGQRPLRVNRAVREAGQALELCTRLRRDVAELKVQALDARDRLERAQAQARASLRYASYDSHQAHRLQQALRDAEVAVAAGMYAAALAEAQSALQSSAALQLAYSQYQQEQERQRQAAMSHLSHQSSGGGGDWGSSSGSSGGGGSFDSPTDTSGGGGSFGGSDNNNTSGGGGSWG